MLTPFVSLWRLKLKISPESAPTLVLQKFFLTLPDQKRRTRGSYELRCETDSNVRPFQFDFSERSRFRIITVQIGPEISRKAAKGMRYSMDGFKRLTACVALDCSRENLQVTCRLPISGATRSKCALTLLL